MFYVTEFKISHKEIELNNHVITTEAVQNNDLKNFMKICFGTDFFLSFS